MRSTRKLASLLLALVMVFALATTVFATETGGTTTTPVTGKITVDNPVADRTYTAYKIFDVVYDDARVNYSYTIDSSNPWIDTVSDYANDTTHGLTLTKVADTTADTFVVTFVDDTNATNKFSAPDFAAALKNALADGSVSDNGHQLSEDGTSVSVKDLKLGYYFVKSSATDALCNLTTTNPDITIHDKNDMPFEKEVDKPNVDVGQTVTFTITGNVPDHSGFTTYTYLITDTMTDGLTFDKTSVKVKINKADVAQGPDGYILTEPNDTDTENFTFKLSINVVNFHIGDDIEVTYNATVNENAIAEIESNKATLTYTNGPTVDDDKTTTVREAKVYTSKIVIDKYDAGDKNTKLSGAKFVLYKEVTTPEGGTATKQYYKWDDTAKKVKWVTDMKDADVKKTDEYGAASFDGLADGTYYLVETKAPAGYNQLKDPVTVPVKGSDTDTMKLSSTANVANQAGAVLPSTGGMGTTVFYVLGAVLVVGAGVLLVTKKRMSQGEV